MGLKRIFFIVVVGVVFMLGCKKKDEPNKVIQPLPINANENIIPGRAAQEFMRLMRDMLGRFVPLINRMAVPNVDFPELSGPDSNQRYTFPVADSFYGQGVMTVQFFNNDGNVIDPIERETSTASFKTATLNGTITGTNFTFVLDLEIVLDIAGNVESAQRIGGNIVITGLNHNLTYLFQATNSTVNFEGLIGGLLNGTGTGINGAATSLLLTFSTNHSADGSLTWEGRSGSIHLEDNGTGTLISNNVLFILD